MTNEPSPVREESYVRAFGSDLWTVQDELGFEPYVKALASFLTAQGTKGPLTVSVEGEWGSGKTSFMKQLHQEIERVGADGDRKPLVVEFSAWRFQEAEGLWAAFALKVLQELKRRTPNRWDRLRACARLRWSPGRRWRSVRPAVFGVAAFIAAGLLMSGLGLNGKATVGLGALAAILLLWKQIQEASGLAEWLIGSEMRKRGLSRDYSEKMPLIETFHEDLRAIISAYACSRRIYCFIDDVDRCDVPRAADVMQALHLLISDDPELIFVVGMDRPKVAASLAAKFEKLCAILDLSTPDEKLQFGEEYLEKFVQIPFQLPRPSEESVRRYIEGLSVSGAIVREEPPFRPRDVWQKIEALLSRRTPNQADALDSVAKHLPAEPGEAEPPRYRLTTRFAQGIDSAAVRRVAEVVAPSLDHNPRRLKQFVNLLRLVLCIRHEMNLFVEPIAGAHKVETVEQVGKFLALTLRWPRFVQCCVTDPELLSNLSMFALGEVERTVSSSQWAKDERLMDFLAAGCDPQRGAALDQSAVADWSLADVDFHRLTTITAPISSAALLPEEARWRVILPYQARDYRYKIFPTGPVPQGVGNVQYGDSDWESGDAAFGGAAGGSPQSPQAGVTHPTLKASVKTFWPPNTDIVIRREFDLAASITAARLSAAVDNDIRAVYINGSLLPDSSFDHEEFAEPDSFRHHVPSDMLRQGTNLIVVHARDRGRQSYLDVKFETLEHGQTDSAVASHGS